MDCGVVLCHVCLVAVFLDGLRRGVMSRVFGGSVLMDCGVALCHVSGGSVP